MDPYVSSFDLVFHDLSLLRKKVDRDELRLVKHGPPFLVTIFQQKPEPGMFDSIKNYMQELDVELGFLEMLLRSIYWSQSIDEPNDNGVKFAQQQMGLGSFLVKIEALVKKSHEDLEYAWKKDYYSQKRVSKLVTSISNLLQEIQVLKPDVKDACEYLSHQSFQSRCPMIDFRHCYEWSEFVYFVERNLYFLVEKADPTNSLLEKVKAFKERFTSLRLCFLPVVSYRFLNPKIQGPVISLGSMVIRAAHLCSLCWVSDQLDQNMSKVMHAMLSDLQNNVEANMPEFLEMYLWLLGKINVEQGISQCKKLVSIFVDYILGTQNRAAIHGELISLVNLFLEIPPSYSEYVQLVMEDIKVVAMEANSLGCSLHSGFAADDLMLFKLLAKIWFIKAEIFLAKQLRTIELFSLSTKSEISALHQGMEFLRTYFADPPAEDVKNRKQILELIEAVMASIHHSFHAKQMMERRARDVLFKLLIMIMLFRAESFLMELLKISAMIAVKDQIEALHKGLICLKGLAVNHSKECTEDEKLILSHSEAVAREVIYLYHSSHVAAITEDMIGKVSLQISHSLEKIKVVKAELKKINLQLPRINFPNTNGSGFIDFLSRNLRELLDHKAHLIQPVKHQIEALTRDIEFLRPLLKSIAEHGIEHLDVQHFGSCVVGVAYKAEFVIDSIAVANEIEWHHVLRLFHVSEEIELIKAQVKTFYDKIGDVKIYSDLPTMRHMISQSSSPRMDEIVVGLNDQEEVIVDQLTRGTLQRDIVSIVGMPGIGKTTLATKLYNNPKVTYHFHIRAWSCVSQLYRKRELLLDILGDIIGLKDDIVEMSDEDLELKLYKSLKQKRYLVILDDIWNSRAWDDLQRSLPNDGNGSRILITSRLQDVILKAKPHSDPHRIRLLSDDESWMLLERKLFHEEGCPRELLKVGKKISKNCKGLPLAVVAIAGLLERTDKEVDWWEQIAESVSSRIVDDPQMRCKDILELSYKNLPGCLKACFLYFGAFLQDKDVPVRKLIWWWIAEGFFLETEHKTIEDLAEDCLIDLVGRSLVIVTKRGSNGEIKACRVHDILHDLCLSKAKEDNFLHSVTWCGESSASFDGLDDDVGFDHDHDPITSYEDYRLCLHSKRKYFVMSRPSGPYTRSLMFYASSDRYPRCPYDISFISKNFKLLRLLDLECINMGNCFPDEIELLIQLRYLSVSGDIDYVPSSIAKLENLVTFLVKGLKGKVVLPNTIWSMARLRHLHVNNYALVSLQDEELEHSSQLANLVAVSTLSFSCWEDTEKIIRCLPNLQKLKCIYSDVSNYEGNCNGFLNLNSLMQLKSLKIYYYGRFPALSSPSFPLNIKKLTLSNFRLPWNCISAIGRLPNLEVLKLLFRAFEGEIWEMKEGEFLKLKFLKLEMLDIVQWHTYNDHLPNLEHLVLRSCKQLEEVPFAFAEIPTLKIIELHGCGHSADESAQKIKEEDIEGLHVIVNPSDLEFTSSS